MILTKKGVWYRCGDKNFFIGQRVSGNDKSDLNGLFGTITEIRTDEDAICKRLDIYCKFDPPVKEEDIKTLESIFSALCGEPKTIDELGLDKVIMRPEMLTAVPEMDDDILYLHDHLGQSSVTQAID